MARARASVELARPQPSWRLRDLLRVACWGFCAAFALFIAFFAATTEVGHGRLHLAMADLREIFVPSGSKPVRPLDAREGRRLAETVRELSTEREAFRTRVAALEQGLGGITGSIARVEKAAREPGWLPMPASNPAPFEDAASETVPAEAASSVHLPSSMPPPSPVPNAKTEFGLDLGNAASVEALRAAWIAASRRHGGLLQGLRPVVQTRERGRAGAVELRLIAGPIASAATAARLCAAMTAAGAVCAPAAFEGQRLAVR